MAFSRQLRDAGIARFFIYSLFFLLLAGKTCAGVSSKFSSIELRRAYERSRATTLLSRDDDDDSCPVSCRGQTPSNFCCSSGNTCLLVASGTTAICCPKGSTCNSIAPIGCDVQALDPAVFPKSPIFTTSLDKALPKCGNKCCPFGYVCGEAKTCMLDIYDRDNSPSSSSAPSSTIETSLPIKSQTGDASETSTAATESSTSAPASKNHGDNIIGLVTAITVACVCFLAGTLILFWLKWGRPRAPQMFTYHKDRSWSSTNSSKSSQSSPTPVLPQHVIQQRGTEDKFIVMAHDTPPPTWPLPPQGLALPGIAISSPMTGFATPGTVVSSPMPGFTTPGTAISSPAPGFATPGTAIWSPTVGFATPRTGISSPMTELPGSPISMRLWQSLADAEIKESQIAYVVTAKQIQKRPDLS